MHLFFSGIGGAGIGPLALIAHQIGYQVSGSDKQNSAYIEYLKEKGITDLYIGQTKENIEHVHNKNPIDWYIYSSSIIIENPNNPELVFCNERSIKTSKRDELLNEIIRSKKLNLIAVAGTHGKSTTTAMIIWLFKQLKVPLSYSMPAKISFGEMGEYDKSSEYFVYEADEFDRNFLSFEPYLSVISGVSWDHHEIFPTREDYQQAFSEFIGQSKHAILWEEDEVYLSLEASPNLTILSYPEIISTISLDGYYNRLDAYLAVVALHRITKTPISDLIEKINSFPGLQRRMEEISKNLFSDYAHTPEKIRGAMSVALEIGEKRGGEVVVVYEPLTNRRQHYIKDTYKDCFKGAKQVYWLPSYLAREDPSQVVLAPEELIKLLDDPAIAKPMKRDSSLIQTIKDHLKNGDLVVGMNGGGGDSLDEWLRANF